MQKDTENYLLFSIVSINLKNRSVISLSSLEVFDAQNWHSGEQSQISEFTLLVRNFLGAVLVKQMV